MKITVTCPQCQRHHEVGESMAGTRAQCRCGHILTVPSIAEQVLEPAPIVVQCPSCLRRYEAKPSLAGTHPKCSCGTTLSIPDPSPECALRDRLESPVLPEPEPAVSGSPSSLFDEMWAEEEAAGATAVLTSVPRRRNHWLFYFCVAGCAVPVLGLMLVVVTSLLGGGSKSASSPAKPVKGPLGWASWCIPPDAKGIVAINVDKFGRSDVCQVLLTLAEVSEEARRERGGMSGTSSGFPTISKDNPPSPAELSAFIQSLAELHAAVTSDGNGVVVLRTKADIALEEAARTGLGLRSASAPLELGPAKTSSGIPYVEDRVSKAVLAKVAPCVFCFAMREGDLHNALARRKRNETPSLSDPLRHAWQGVKGDILVAMLVSQDSQAGSPLAVPGISASGLGGADPWRNLVKPEWVAVGITTDSNLVVRATMAFPNAAAAAKCSADINGGIRATEAKARSMDADVSMLPANIQAQLNAIKAMLQKGLELLRQLHLASNGNLVQINGSWEARSLEELLRQIQSLGKSPPDDR
jgi:hypothetical protein